MGAKFLNIELEVTAPFDLQGLADAFGSQFVLNSCIENKSLNLFFLSGSVCPLNWDYVENNNPDANTLALCICKIVNKLAPEERALWNKAARKALDVGFESSDDNGIGLGVLKADTLAAISKIDADLAISVYGGRSIVDKLNA